MNMFIDLKKRQRGSGREALPLLPTLLLPALLLTTQTQSAQAQTTTTTPVFLGSYNISVDTSSLTPGTNYTLEYQLSDGSFTGDGNTQLSVTNLNFDGGTAQTPTAQGGAVISGGVLTLTDTTTSFPNADYMQNFTVPSSAGQFLSFTLGLKQNGTEAATPDSFAFNLLNPVTGNSALATTDPFGTSLLTINYASAGHPTPQLTNYSAGAGGMVTVTPAPVPEASTGVSFGLMALLCLGGAGLRVRARRLPP